ITYGSTRLRRGWLANLMGQPVAGLPDIDTALEITREYRMTSAVGEVLLQKARLLAGLDDRTGALEAFNEAGRLFAQVPFLQTRADVHLHLGIWRIRWGEADLASREAQAALEYYLRALEQRLPVAPWRLLAAIWLIG